MIDEENEQQEVVKDEGDVSKAFGNESNVSVKKEEADPKAADQKEPEKKETVQKQEGAESASTQQQSGKTYTQDEVDAMMAKARKKYTGKGDEVPNKEVTEDGANVDSADAENSTEEPSGMQDFATGITVDKLAQAELKASMAIGGVNPAKVQRAVRLIDINNVIENGMYSEEKAKQEIETLLQEWPELKTQASDTTNGNGFYFGAPEQEEQTQEDKQKGMFSSIFGN